MSPISVILTTFRQYFKDLGPVSFINIMCYYFLIKEFLKSLLRKIKFESLFAINQHQKTARRNLLKVTKYLGGKTHEYNLWTKREPHERNICYESTVIQSSY